MKEHLGPREAQKANRDSMLKDFEDLELSIEHCVDSDSNCEEQVIRMITYHLSEAKRYYQKWMTDDESREQRARRTVEFFDNPGIYVPDAEDLKDAESMGIKLDDEQK